MATPKMVLRMRLLSPTGTDQEHPQRKSCRSAYRTIAFLCLGAALIVPANASPPETAEEQIEFFEKNVRPLLAKNCWACHNPDLKTAELDLTTAAGFTAGAQSGALISKENPAESRLLQVIGYEARLKMPPTGKLSEEEIQTLARWVGMGAPWPNAEPSPPLRPSKNGKVFTEEEKNFWAFRPVQAYEPPQVNNEKWVRSPVDRFILKKLEAKGLKPAPPAGKETLLRRATYDLTGLPPTEKEIADFLADRSPKAFEKVVDRLLASARYGERWGRHWLDVARYADSTGNDEDHRYPFSWRYRDYVIESFNRDIPYDQFVREQIAGDLLPPENPEEVNRRGIIATGFLALGQKAVAQQDKKKMLYDIYDDQLDAVSKAFLGVTLACARCHDHKFDPFLTKDYYALIGIFASTKNFSNSESHVAKLHFSPLAPKKEFDRYLAHREILYEKAGQIDRIVEEETERADKEHIPRTADYMPAARRVYEGEASLDAIARDAGLKEETLRRWVEYLKPNGEARPHLEKWFAASADRQRAAAETYREQLLERAAEWRKSLASWRKRQREKLKGLLSMPGKGKPKFKKEKDPFFYEVYFNGGPLAWPEDEPERLFSEPSRARLHTLNREFLHLKETSPATPEMACAVAEGEPVVQRLFIRGDHGNPGEPVPKRFPLILAGDDPPLFQEGSGRRELAEWLTRPDNPLTARVMVNRIWQGHFGEGLVRTPNNFGRMGERPTHPKLLDYLAKRFVEDGWSVKKMHRLLMLSSAYRMSSRAVPRQLDLDQINRLLSRFNPRRLDVEEIRDGLLAMDGSLDFTLGGTLVTFRTYTDSENSNERLSLDPETNNRRMVYLPLRRANLPPLLNMFDFGDATTSLGKRSPTNVAPQALFMMNSRFVAERSQKLAETLLADDSLRDQDRIRRVYLQVLNRRPNAGEIQAGLGYLENFRKRFPESIEKPDGWQSFCRILMASNEFIFVD